MKKLLLLILLIPSLTHAQSRQDCYECRIWNSLLPQVNLPQWPVELIKVEKEEYVRNEKATYCTRPPEMIDTVVIHHSETPATDTPQDINSIHINRSTAGDPWYMVAYSYLINSPYPGTDTPRARVTEGRPLEIVGAHAGGEAYVSMDKEQKQMWDEGKVLCGKTGETFSVDPEQVRGGKIKANVTTIGIVVIGNYAPMGRQNPSGYVGKPVVPSRGTLETAAKMSCQLQKKYPKIKFIKWHSYYRPTTCPGNLKADVDKIRKMAKEYGCDFK